MSTYFCIFFSGSFIGMSRGGWNLWWITIVTRLLGRSCLLIWSNTLIFGLMALGFDLALVNCYGPRSPERLRFRYGEFGLFYSFLVHRVEGVRGGAVAWVTRIMGYQMWGWGWLALNSRCIIFLFLFVFVSGFSFFSLSSIPSRFISCCVRVSFDWS